MLPGDIRDNKTYLLIAGHDVNKPDVQVRMLVESDGAIRQAYTTGELRGLLDAPVIYETLDYTFEGSDIRIRLDSKGVCVIREGTLRVLHAEPHDIQLVVRMDKVTSLKGSPFRRSQVAAQVVHGMRTRERLGKLLHRSNDLGKRHAKPLPVAVTGYGASRWTEVLMTKALMECSFKTDHIACGKREANSRIDPSRTHVWSDRIADLHTIR